jgi:hypothetical protein
MSLSDAISIHVAGNPERVDRTGLQTDSDDFLFYWPARIGPTGTLVAYRFARYATVYGPVEWNLDELAATLSVPRSRLTATLNRLDSFGVGTFVDCTHFHINLYLPHLSERRLRNFPPELAYAYRARFLSATVHPKL